MGPTGPSDDSLVFECLLQRECQRPLVAREVVTANLERVGDSFVQVSKETLVQFPSPLATPKHWTSWALKKEEEGTDISEPDQSLSPSSFLAVKIPALAGAREKKFKQRSRLNSFSNSIFQFLSWAHLPSMCLSHPFPILPYIVGGDLISVGSAFQAARSADFQLPWMGEELESKKEEQIEAFFFYPLCLQCSFCLRAIPSL